MKQNYIAGEWKESGNAYRNINPPIPVTASTSTRWHRLTTSLPPWRERNRRSRVVGFTPQQRFTALDSIGTEILARKEDLGRLLAREEGKTLPKPPEKSFGPDRYSNFSPGKPSVFRASTFPLSGPEWRSIHSVNRSAWSHS